MIKNELGTLLLFLIVLVLVISIFGFVIRKLLGVERKKWFSYNHLNERHKKLDWSVLIFFISLFFISTVYMNNNDSFVVNRNFETWIILIAFIITFTITTDFFGLFNN